MKKTLTAILLTAAAAAVPLAGAATSAHRHPASKLAGSKPGVGGITGGQNALLVGSKPGVGGITGGQNALLVGAKPGLTGGSGAGAQLAIVGGNRAAV